MVSKISIQIKKSLKTRFDKLPERIKRDYKSFESYVNKEIEDDMHMMERQAEKNPCHGGYSGGHTVAQKDENLEHPTCTDCGQVLVRYIKDDFGTESWKVYRPKKKVDKK